MSTRDLVNRVSPAQSLKAQVVTAAVNGSGVDLQGFDSAVFVVDAGAITGTTPTITPRAEESDDNATFTPIAATDLDGGLLVNIATGADNVIQKRGYLGAKRYVRLAISAVGGTTPSAPICGSVVRGHPHLLPTP
jgi:hypothetical protein